MQELPTPPITFLQKKKKILEQLAVPDSDYSDASPKGSVDEGIRDLIEEINAVEGFVTTSSCAGRVSVFVEGNKLEREDGQIAGVGGKGAGGAWLFVSHDPVPEDDAWITSLELKETEEDLAHRDDGSERRLIHFKFEPMILHIQTASPIHAQLLLRSAIQAGFRESGAVNITYGTSHSTTTTNQGSTTPNVAIRSMGLSFESLIGQQTSPTQRHSIVSRSYLHTLLRIANDRFVENTKRIDRFRQGFRESLSSAQRKADEGWEDADVRRERKRAEGLRRKAELNSGKDEEVAVDDGETWHAGSILPE